jgi:hypothetical protein
MTAGDWFEGNGSGGQVDAVEMMHACVKPLSEIVAAGALVSCGLSGDGGALAVTVMLDGRKRREWFREADTMLAWCGEAVIAVDGAPAKSSPTSGRGSRSRRA